MNEMDELRTFFLPRHVEAEAALRRGDLAAFGACDSGWDQVSVTFRWVAWRFSDGTG